MGGFPSGRSRINQQQKEHLEAAAPPALCQHGGVNLKKKRAEKKFHRGPKARRFIRRKTNQWDDALDPTRQRRPCKKHTWEPWMKFGTTYVRKCERCATEERTIEGKLPRELPPRHLA